MHTPIRAHAGTRGKLVGYGAVGPPLPFLAGRFFYRTQSTSFFEFCERRCGSFVPRMDRCCPQTLTWEVVENASCLGWIVAYLGHAGKIPALPDENQFRWRAVGPTTKFAGLSAAGNLGMRLSVWSGRESGCLLTSDPVNVPGEAFCAL